MGGWSAGWDCAPGLARVGDALAGSAGAEQDDFRQVVVHAAEFLGREEG